MSTRGRIGLLIGGVFLLALLLVGRLFQITVFQHSRYVAEAKQQQDATHSIQPLRGAVYLQDGASHTTTLVTESVSRFAFSLTPRNVQHKPEFAQLLAKITNTNSTTLLNELNLNGLYINPLLHGLTKEQVTDIANQINTFEKTYIPSIGAISLNFDSAQGDTIYFANGTFFSREYERVYPESSLLSQVLGFVNDEGVGQYGLEAQYDNELKGYSGQVQVQQDSQGTVLSQEEVVQEQDGENLQLSIDRNIQYVVEQDLAQEVQTAEAKSGSVIIMNPHTGQIVAMASYPTFDPTNFRTTTADNVNLFQNPTVSNVWEPGSVFKPIIMAAALDQGLVTPDTSGDYPESVTVQGHKIETALRKAYGVENMTDVLVNSDNVAMVSIGNLLGNQKMSDYIKRFGFGSKTGIDLSSEATGQLMPINQWQDVNRATMSFGQGISVTPIQILNAYSAIATNGQLVTPHVVQSIQQADGTWKDVATTQGAQVIKPATAQTLQKMLTQVIVKADKRAGVPGYVLAGKTGTAQVPDPVNGGYITDAYNHSFAGFGPVGDPKFVMLTKIDQPNIQKTGTFAESTAVPLFGQIAQFLLQYYQVTPGSK